MKALFFAEGGPGAGLGHLRRSSALADGMARRGWECRFLASQAETASWLGERGQRLAPCEAPTAGRLPEADYACDVLVVDSYPASNEEIRSKADGKARLVLAFDDLMSRHPAANAVLNAGVLAPEQDWPAGPERLLGPSYHPLPSEYAPLPAPRAIRPRAARALVTLGGAGQADLFERVIAAVRRAFPGAAVDCVAGPFLQGSIGARAGVALHRSPRTLDLLMAACDLAVAASGQTLFELAATGTPAVALCLADNQLPNLRGMERAGSVLSAGSVADAGFEAALSERLAEAADPKVRARLSEAGRALVDGRGAERVEAALSALLAKRRAAR